MYFIHKTTLPWLGWLAACAGCVLVVDTGHAQSQYAFQEIDIPAASADETILGEWSVDRAAQYLERGAEAWSGKSRCVSCHTNGTYLMCRPELSPVLGRPSPSIRNFFVDQLQEFQKQDVEKLKRGITPTQIAYLAAGLAQWDASLGNQTTWETEQALELLLRVQSGDGSIGNANCWPPLESSSYHGATVAATAIATAPGYLAGRRETPSGYLELIKFLKSTEPPHDYARLLLLRTASRVDDLISAEQKKSLIEMVFRHQRPDGGWSIRTFASPESWGSGNRAMKLRSEPEFASPPSDGHQTGLAIVALLDSGLPAGDPRIQTGLGWLKNNQRQSGRWWTRSLNTDRWHFITYSGTAYALLALYKSGEVPRP